MDVKQKEEAAEILYEGFKSKWDHMWISADESSSKKIISQTAQFDQAIIEYDDNNHITGIAGYDLSENKLFTALNRATLIKELGLVKGLFIWLRNLRFEYFKVDFKEDMFHIDTIAVSRKSRGQGIGSQLLHKLEEKGRALGKKRIVLEVIDTNTRAKELYERIGYKVTGFETLPFPHNIHTKKAGFSGYYIMEKDLSR